MKLNVKKGLNIKLKGAVKDSSVTVVDANICAVIPDDFPGFTPKVDVAEGNSVKVGSVLLHDKNSPKISLVSPVSGRVKSVVRGERRKVLRIEIESDGAMTPLWNSMAESPAHTDNVIDALAVSGLLAQIRRRPFDVVPRPDVAPRDIFVSAFDSAPLAPSLVASLPSDAADYLTTAVQKLKTLTSGNIYISTGADWNLPDIDGAKMVAVEGPHPAGNPGIQAANIAPVNKGEEIWTLDVVTLYRIGYFFRNGVLDTSTVVAVTGPEALNPCLIRTVVGADMEQLTKGHIKEDSRHKRIVSGNVLTGVAVDCNHGFLHFPWRQITIMAEGDDVDEFMGWASMSPKKLSVSKAFPLSRFTGLFAPDARLGGGRRAMIMSGEYDRVMPADIMVEYLLKAIISRNIDDMEALGIYEIAPEDVALCEFVDTSKLPVQQIVRDGLDFMRKETE